MTPTKVVLEKTATHYQVRVFVPTPKGSTVIESVKIATGKSLPLLRKRGTDYAKRFGITFTDQTA